MVNVEQLGWKKEWVGELDHRLLKTPSVKLRSAIETPQGDVVYSVDFRFRLPNNNDYLTDTEMHSIEHFILEGLQRLLPDNFISIGLMGCQTGFYIILLNEGRFEVITNVLAQILEGISQASEVPYCNIEQCGNYKNHSLQAAQQVAKEILAARSQWHEVA